MTILAGADGLQNVGILADDDCCPPSICNIDICGLICNFVKLLPSGPLWDIPKQKALSQYEDVYVDCGLTYCPPRDDGCTSLVQHSIYTARRLYENIRGPLWDALRESDPLTAYDTLSDWVERLGWQDCFGTACRNPKLGPLTPYEVQGICGPIFCGNGSSEELSRSIEHALVLAITRIQMGPIKNLAGINWIIEPLGAFITPLESECSPDGSLTTCEYCFEIAPNFEQILKWEKMDCGKLAKNYIPSFYTNNGPCSPAGLPDKVYPGVLAAECIIRALIPCTTPLCIKRKC